ATVARHSLDSKSSHHGRVTSASRSHHDARKLCRAARFRRSPLAIGAGVCEICIKSNAKETEDGHVKYAPTCGHDPRQGRSGRHQVLLRAVRGYECEAV